MEQKLSVGETLSEVFRIYRDQAGVLLPVAFWVFLVVAVIERLTAEVLALFPIALVVGLGATFLYQGMVVRLVEDVQDGRRDHSVGDLVRSVVPVLWPLVGAGILASLGIGGGLILLVVPGLYLLTIWAVVSPVIVIERRRVFDAFGRSRQLVRDHGWPTLGVMAVAFLIGAVVGILLVQLADALAEGDIVRVVFSVLAQTVTAPVEGLVAAVLYFRLLEIKGAESASSASAAAASPPVDS
jgi:hypothetical protein